MRLALIVRFWTFGVVTPRSRSPGVNRGMEIPLNLEIYLNRVDERKKPGE
jgi:hypothetical protein